MARIDIQTFPYPVARPVALAFEEEGARALQSRLWDVVFAGYQVFRMATLPVLAAYLDAPLATEMMPGQVDVASIATAVARVRSPFYSDWMTLLSTLAKRLTPEKVGLEPCLPLREAVAALKGSRFTAFGERYRAANGDPAPPHEALLGLRNGLAHGGPMPEDETCRDLLKHYLPALEAVLSAFSFLGQCELRVRDGEFEGEYTRVRILRGPEVPDPVRLGDDEEWENAMLGSSVAMRLASGPVLALAPLFHLGAGSVVGLYDGHYLLEMTGAGTSPKTVRARHIFYLGAGHDRWRDSSLVDGLVKKLEARKIQWHVEKANLAPWTIVDSLHDVSRGTLSDLTGQKYFPECFVERTDLQREWECFLRADDDAIRTAPSGPKAVGAHRSGLILVGVAGSGKSAWSAHRAMELLAEGVPADAGEAEEREGRNLVLFLRGDMISERDRREDRLLATVLERMGLRDQDFASFGDLLKHLNDQWPKDRVPGRRLVILFDAVNEAMRAENLLREAFDLVRAASAYPWCKVVLTLRREFLGVLRGKVEAQEKSVFLAVEPCLYRPMVEEGPVGVSRDPVLELPLLSGDREDGVLGEAGKAYELYRAKGLTVDRGSKDRKPGCRTPWRELSRETRELLRTPLFLYVFHHCFSNRPATAVRGQAMLLAEHVRRLFKEHEALEESCLAVVERLLRNGRPELSDEDANDLRLEWAAGRTLAEARLYLSPLEAMVHAGLLRRRTRQEGTGYLFVFETVLEFLIARLWEAEDPSVSVERLKARIKSGPSPETFPQYWNAFQFPLERLLVTGRSSDWPELVNDSSPRALDAVAARVWASAAVSCPLPSDATDEALLETSPGRVLRAYEERRMEWAAHRLDELWLGIRELARPEWSALALCSERAIVDYLVEEEGRRELAKDLARVETNLGAALYNRGALAGGVGCFERALATLQRLVEEEGRRELANDLASVEMNLGVALSDLGDLAGGVGCFERALATFQRLVEEEGRRELADDLARVETNLGAALCNRGDLAGGVGCFERARAILVRLVEEEGRRDLANDLASVETNLGNALRRGGDLDGAVAAHERARATFQRLVEEEGRSELDNALANVEINLGNALFERGDLAGAVACFERALAIRMRLVEEEGRRELANDLARVETNLGVALRLCGDLAGAVGCYERARTTFQRLVEEEGRRELANDLACVETNLGLALLDRGDQDGAVGCCERARAIRVRLVEGEGRREFANDLANVEMNLGNALLVRGDLDGAVGCHERARAIRVRLVEEEGRRELANDLAAVETNLGVALSGRGDLDGAVAAYERARALLVRLVEEEGRRELAKDLANVESKLGAVLYRRGDLAGAAGCSERALATFQRLVEEEGRRDLANDLASVEMRLGVARCLCGNLDGGVELIERARAAFQRLVEEEGRKELADDLASAEMNLAVALSSLGDLAGAVGCHERARAALQSLVEEEGRVDLANDLATVEMNLGNALLERGDLAGAVACYERTLAIRMRLVLEEGRRELADDLARVETNLGVALRLRGDLAGAVGCYERARAILVRLVEEEGRRELANDLGRVESNLCKALLERGDLAGAVACWWRAMSARWPFSSVWWRKRRAGN